MKKGLQNSLKRDGIWQIISACAFLILCVLIAIVVFGTAVGGSVSAFDGTWEKNGAMMVAGAASGVLFMVILIIITFVLSCIFRVLGVIDLYRAGETANNDRTVKFINILPWVIMVVHIASFILPFYTQLISCLAGGISCMCVRRKLLKENKTDYPS